MVGLHRGAGTGPQVGWAALRGLAMENSEVTLPFDAVERLHANLYEGYLERDDVVRLP